ncbi:hypothetical protein WAI99_23550, partial [Acinetobacter baumannii]
MLFETAGAARAGIRYLLYHRRKESFAHLVHCTGRSDIYCIVVASSLGGRSGIFPAREPDGLDMSPDISA